MVRKGLGIWKDLDMPSSARLKAGRPVISSPRKTTEPSSLNSAPEMQLIIVVLPDPLGPMRPNRSRGFRCMLTLLSATKPPNRLVRP